MATIPVPSLTPAGWITEIRDKCDKLMSYFFYSDYSQSNIYLGSVTSLPDIIKEHGNDATAIALETQKAMKIYLLRYFENVQCEAKVVIPENPDDNRMDLQVSVIVFENGVQYDFFRLLKTANGTLTEIIDRNNHGGAE